MEIAIYLHKEQWEKTDRFKLSSWSLW